MNNSDQRTSRVSEVALQLREAIYEGRHRPGAPLRELVLARELQVSQATVREALGRLEHEGLVTRRENVGTTVTRLSPRDIAERLNLRVMLEVFAARAAAERMTEQEFAELERRLDALGRSVESNRYFASAQSDLDFHRYVWQCSGNETLCGMLEQLVTPLFAFISVLRSHHLDRLPDVVASHRPLLEALRSRDAGRIREAFTRGVTASYEPFLGTGNPGLKAAAYGFLGAADTGADHADNLAQS
ncbi:MAG TPA: GntR family transcriptional regulator [Bryobacteraceae bacterium]|nr:GntR family transcriptional regulator [Bryobacteraceae bacterium]